MEQLEAKNLDVLLQRRSLEFILDDTLKDLTDSLRQIESSYQLIKDLQNQCQSEEKIRTSGDGHRWTLDILGFKAHTGWYES